MALSLYNTLTRRKEVFQPLEPGIVRMYSCGLTVYNYAHIGNLRTYIFSDILRRTLEYEGYEVLHVMNVTDVGHLTSDADEGEDKMEKGAREAGKDIWEIARFYEEAFWRDLELLNIEKPKVICRATEHIPEMIALIQRLMERGHAYETDQAVYFDISTFPKYTEFTRQPLEQKVIGAREEVQEDPQKRHPADFALWFKAVGRFKNHIMRWESPWGVGFPGWHIECSAMAMKYLGETLDIHTGGEDHIWVHHPNEIAQSEAATGKQFVRFWMHGAFLVVGSQNGSDEERRMGKSEGNFITLQTLLDKGYDPLAYRYACLMAHYRQKLRFTWESMDAAAAGYASLKQFAARALQVGGEEPPWVQTYRDRFRSAIEDDLNMPQAMAAVSEMIREAETRKEYGVLPALYDFDRVLGLKLREAAEAAVDVDAVVKALIKEREEARKARNWARADEIRNQLAEQGIVLEDTPSGTLWRRIR
ncbi:MAG: cysteine--tRNA ligase [Armatimonadota bacterium]|nr:cysteine--tRNA ligase [Armatimonadota bacterium]